MINAVATPNLDDFHSHEICAHSSDVDNGKDSHDLQHELDKH